MATTQDASVGIGVESTFKTGVTPTRWLPYVDESLDWAKTVVQGVGLRSGSRVARSNQRVVPTAQGSGDVTWEAQSKGMGLIWQACLGSGTSTLVSGSTYQQNFTLGDTPSSLTIQKGSVQAGGTVDPVTYLGCMVSAWTFALGNAGIATLKPTFDLADFTTGTAYAAPSYATQPNLFHFAGASVSSGTLTAPTTTTTATGATPVTNVRDFSVTVNNNIRNDRFNAIGTGRKDKPLEGLRDITGSMTAEYSSTVFRDAFLNETPVNLILTFTAGALSTGLETLQIVLPECKFDSGGIPMTNGADLITQPLNFTVLDNQTAAQPIWVIMRTADTAL